MKIADADIDRFMRMRLSGGYQYDVLLRKAFRAAIKHGADTERQRCAGLVRNHPGNGKRETLLRKIGQ